MHLGKEGVEGQLELPMTKEERWDVAHNLDKRGHKIPRCLRPIAVKIPPFVCGS